jgi:(methylthio)acryloyl-CoA hydratase
MTLQYTTLSIENGIALVTLNRPAKRNALSDGFVRELKNMFETFDSSVKVAVIHGSGDHFCAGLDLSELKEQDAVDGIHHSRMWHAALNSVQFGLVPVVAALHGAVVGGGLELASSVHIRVADDTTFYGLPEGQRGIFVGGGGSVRIPKLMGVARMTDMMLTGRVYDAQEGLVAGLSQYMVPKGQALAKAMELATKIAGNAAMTNYALTHVLPRIAEQPADHGYMMEAMISSVAQSAPEAKARVRDFLEKRAGKVAVNR